MYNWRLSVNNWRFNLFPALLEIYPEGLPVVHAMVICTIIAMLVERKDLSVTDNGRRGQAIIRRRPGPDAAAPGFLEFAGRREMVHRVVRVAARLRPIGIHERLRQDHFRAAQLRIGLDRLIRRQHRDALAPNTILRSGLNELIERLATRERNAGQENDEGDR